MINIFSKKSKRSATNEASTKAKRKSGGFTLFVAVLVSSLLLAVGFSIGNIVLKQLTIAGGGGGSLVAFYAADSAVECATYWDRKKADGTTWALGPFSTSTLADGGFDPSTGVQCGPNGQVQGWTKTCDNSAICNDSSLAATTTFMIDFKDPYSPTYLACAAVVVYKKYDPATFEETTRIESRGYNTDLVAVSGGGWACNLDRQRVVERGILQNY